MQSIDSEKILILGIGNLLLSDEGIGVHAARALHAEELPNNVEVIEIGTSVLDALEVLETAGKVIVVDAMIADGEPGSVYRSNFGDCGRNDVIGSMHGFDLKRVLALTRRSDEPEVIVIGVEPKVIDWGMELSESVGTSIPSVIAAVKNEF